MTDVPASLGIEAVECLAEDARSPGTVTVRVTGRWRRRRPELRGQPMLAVDTERGRRRFLAMPEPPSLAGPAPGTWRMSFSVPAALAPSLPGRTFLQLGGALVPLAIGDVPASESSAPAESVRREATEPAGGVARLERALDESHAQSDRLRGELADRERRLRLAEQHAHSERALRAEVEEQLGRSSRAAQHDLSVLHERVADLERELTRMRRAVDEAQHMAAAAAAARADAVRRLAARGVAPAAAPPANPTRRELELARGSPGAPRAQPITRPPERAGDRVALRHEAAMSEHRTQTVLKRELTAAREEIEAQRRRSARAHEAVELVRAEIRHLRAALPPGSGMPTEPPAEPVQAERLSAALARLREQPRAMPAGDAEPAPQPDPAPRTPAPVAPAPPPAATRPWLSPAFRKLAAQDASAAGRLLVGLLPAQNGVGVGAVAYDLVMSDVLIAHVTVGSTGQTVELDASTRPLSEVDFQLVGDLARIARLLAAGPLVRRLGRLAPGRPVARVRGDRRRVAALDGLIGGRLTLAQLYGAGVRLDPLLTVTLAAVMIDATWSRGERFTLGHREVGALAPDTYLLVRDGRPPLASAGAPHGSAATVVVCPGDQLLAVLGGAVAPTEVVGDERPLAAIRQWLDRAQSD
jgi:hypothetical protein